MSPRRAMPIGGAPADDPAAALREHLIDATEALLATTPVSSITTRDIARAAGVSDGAPYNYFADKTDLVLATLLRRFADLVVRFEAGLPEPGTGTVEDNLFACATGLFDLEAEIVPTLAGLLTEPGLLQRLFESVYREPFGPPQIRGRLVAYLEAEQRLGRVSPSVDPAASAALLVGSIAVLALTGLVVPATNRSSLAEQIRPLVAALVHGLTPAAST